MRLSFDQVRDAHVVLYPEGVLFPNDSAVAVLRRCNGTANLAEITAELGRDYRAVDLAQVGELLARLAARRLVEVGH